MPITEMTMKITSKERKKPRAGDTKTVKGVKFVRRIKRCASTGALIKSGSNYRYEWIPL